MRLIDADALKDRLQALSYDDWNQGVSTTWANAYAECADMVEDMPTVEPERKTGRWIPQDHNHTHGNVSTLMYFSPVCSECGHAGDFNMNFCPNCGANMKGEQDD